MKKFLIGIVIISMLGMTSAVLAEDAPDSTTEPIISPLNPGPVINTEAINPMNPGPVVIDDFSGVKVIKVNNEEISDIFVDDNGALMTPIRSIAENLGFTVGWDEETRTVTVGGVSSMQIGKNSYNGAAVTGEDLKSAPIIVNDKTYVPVEYYTDVLGVEGTAMSDNGETVDIIELFPANE